MKKIFIFIFIGLVLLGSCYSHSSSHLQEVFKEVHEDELLEGCETMEIVSSAISYDVPDIDLKEHKMCKLEELFDSVYVVRLETLDDNIIGKIDELYIWNDTIYVLDSWSTKTVCMFDMNGKFIRRIGIVGNGPGEYVEPTSFYVNDKSILIYDQWQHKGCKYDHTGKLLSEHWLPFLSFNLVELKNGDVLCYGIDNDNDHLSKIMDYKFWMCDSSYSKIKKIGYYCEHKKYNRPMMRWFNNYNSNCYYFDYEDNSYYKIKDNGDLEMLFALRFKNNKDDRFNIDDEYMREVMKKGERFPITNCLLLNDVVAYSMPTIGPVVHVFHNTKDGKILHCTSADMLNSDLSRVLFLAKINTCYKDCFVYCLSPERILYINKQLTSNIPDLWDGASEACRRFDKKLLESLHEEDNDILVFAKLKEHFD